MNPIRGTWNVKLCDDAERDGRLFFFSGMTLRLDPLLPSPFPRFGKLMRASSFEAHVPACSALYSHTTSKTYFKWNVRKPSVLRQLWGWSLNWPSQNSLRFLPFFNFLLSLGLAPWSSVIYLQLNSCGNTPVDYISFANKAKRWSQHIIMHKQWDLEHADRNASQTHRLICLSYLLDCLWSCIKSQLETTNLYNFVPFFFFCILFPTQFLTKIFFDILWPFSFLWVNHTHHTHLGPIRMPWRSMPTSCRTLRHAQMSESNPLNIYFSTSPGNCHDTSILVSNPPGPAFDRQKHHTIGSCSVQNCCSKYGAASGQNSLFFLNFHQKVRFSSFFSPKVYIPIEGDGTRTHNLRLRRPTRYPFRHTPLRPQQKTWIGCCGPASHVAFRLLSSFCGSKVMMSLPSLMVIFHRPFCFVYPRALCIFICFLTTYIVASYDTPFLFSSSSITVFLSKYCLFYLRSGHFLIHDLYLFNLVPSMVPY